MIAHVFDEPGMRRAVKSIRKSEQEPLDTLPVVIPRPVGDPIKWKMGYNASGETIPAFSVVRLEQGSVINGVYHMNLTKPSTTFTRFYGITGSQPISAASTGGYHTESWLCTYDSGTPATGEEWGAKPGQWTLSKGYPGIFEIEGLWDSTNKYVLGQRKAIAHAYGLAQGAIAKNSTSGIVEVFSGAPGSGASIITSMTITAVHNPWEDIADDKRVGVNWRNGYACLDAREC